MVIDTFLYYNEIELLELRLKVLYDYVDRFVIVEGDHTHKGDPIPFRAKNDLKKLGYENDRKDEALVPLDVNRPECVLNHLLNVEFFISLKFQDL